MAGRLVVLDRAGRAKSKNFVLSSGMCTLGRSAACDIRILLPEVNPHHATVTVHANQTVVRNVGSGTTLVNNAPVSVSALQHGDELDICGRKLRWEYDTPQAPKRNKTQPALALPAAPTRAARRGTLAAPPRPPDRALQLALELRHRASMPANSGAGGKQVAIVQPQRRNTDNQNESASPRPEPAQRPAPRKSQSARLHTPTKATLWIESRRGRARATSLRAATPLRLAVLRRALTPVTKIQAPLHVDHTKQAALMLMAGHAPRFVPRRPAPAAAPASSPAPAPARAASRRAGSSTPRGATPGKSTRKTSTRKSGKQSVSVLETSTSEPPRSAATPLPPKSALKSGRSRKTESIKFDLSNLEPRSEDDDGEVSGEASLPALRYSSSPPSPSPRRPLPSRGGRMLQALGSPLQSPLRSPSARSSAPASPRSLKSARGSIIVRKALESSDTFVTEYGEQSRRSDLEAYSVVDLVSLDSDASRSVYGSAAPGSPPARRSRGSRSRSRLDDSTRTVDSLEDESPKSSRKLVKSASKRSRSLNDAYPDSPQTYISLSSSPKSIANLSTTAKRGSRSRLDSSDLLESPSSISIESMKKSLSRQLSASKRSPRTRNNTLNSSGELSPRKTETSTKRNSSGDATITLGSPKNISIISLNDSQGKRASGSRSRNRADDSSFQSPDISANSTRKSLGKTISPTKLSRSQIDNVTLGSPENSVLSNKKSLGNSPSPTKRLSRSAGTLGSPQVSLNSSRNSAGKTPSPTKRGSRSQLNDSVPPESPKNISAASRKSQGKSPTQRSSRSQLDNESLESPNLSTASRKSTGKTTPKRGSRVNNITSPISPVLTNSTRKSLGKSLSIERSSRSQVYSIGSPKSDSKRPSGTQVSVRASRSKIIDTMLSPQLDALTDSTRKSLGNTLSSKRGSRSQTVETILSSPETSVLTASTRKSLSTSTKRSSRNVESILSSPEADTTTKSTRKSSSASNRGSRSKIIDSMLSPQLDSLADSTRKSLGKTLSTTKRGSLASPELDASANSTRKSTVLILSDSKRASRQAGSPFNSLKALANSTRNSFGRTPKGSQSQDSTLESPKDSPRKSPKINVTNNSTRKSAGPPSTSKRSSRSRVIDSVLSPQLDALSDSTRKSLSKTLSVTKRGTRGTAESVISPKNASKRKTVATSPSKRSSRSLNGNVPVGSPKDTSRKSQTQTLSQSNRRTASLPLSPEASTSAKKPRVSTSTSRRGTGGVAGSPAASPSAITSPLSKKSAKSPSNTPLACPTAASPRKSPKSPAASPSKSPAGSLAKSPAKTLALSPILSKSRTSRKTLTVSITSPRSKTVADGEVTPEECVSPEDAGTPMLSIRSLLDATAAEVPDEPPRKRGRPAPDKRKTFAALHAPRTARGSVRSKSLILVRDAGDVTPTGIAELTPEAVKTKHSSAKKSRSRRSIIDNLDDSGLVKHLFNSPVKRKLSQSMSEFSRRLEEAEESGPSVSGVKRLFTKRSPRNELRDFDGVRRLMRTPRARRSIKNDLTDIAGVKAMFDSSGDGRAPRGSPRDHLGRLSGLRGLFRATGPRDDLSDVRGVRELFKRGPKNELDASGVKDALRARSPVNDLRDVRGVRALFRQAKPQTSFNVSGVARLLDEAAPAHEPAGRRARVAGCKSFSGRATQQPAAGPAGRARSSGGARYAEHTLPLKKRSLERAPLPLKKRSLVHSTPLRGRAARAAAPRESPIAAGPAPAPVGSPTVVHDSPKTSKPVQSPKHEVVQKSDSVKVSPKKTRAVQAQAAASSRRATRRGKTASPHKKPTPKKSKAIKKAPASVEEQTPKKAAEPKSLVSKAATPKKTPTPKKTTRAKKVVAPKKITPKKSRGKKVPSPSPKKAIAKATRAKKPTTPEKTATSRKSRAPQAATRAKQAVAPKPSPKKSPTPKKATRSKKVIPEKAASPKKVAAKNPTVVVKKPRVVVAPVSPKPTRAAKKVSKSPITKSPVTKSRAKKAAPAAPVEKRSRKQAAAASPAKKAARVSLVLPKPSPVLKPQPATRAKRSARNETKAQSPKKAVKKNPAAGDAPVQAQKGRRGQAASPKKATPLKKGKATPEPKGARAPRITKKDEKAKPKGKTEIPATPEPKRRGRKSPATPEAKSAKAAPKKSRKAAASPKAEPKQKVSPDAKKGRRTAAKQVEEPAVKRGRSATAAQVVKTKTPPPRRAAEDAAPQQAAKPKGKKVTIVEPAPSPPRGRKRKNDAVDKHKEPSPKKPRAARAARAAPAAAPARRRR